MFWFLLLGLLLVIGAVTLAVNGSGVGRGGVAGGLGDPIAERTAVVMPADRPLARADVDGLRLPLGFRGYRMAEVDDVLDRLSAELSERDARIAELEAVLAGAQAGAVGGDLLAEPGRSPAERSGTKPTDEETALSGMGSHRAEARPDGEDRGTEESADSESAERDGASADRSDERDER